MKSGYALLALFVAFEVYLFYTPIIVQTTNTYIDPGCYVLNKDVKGPVLKITYAACDIFGNCNICKVDEPEPVRDKQYILTTAVQDLDETSETQFDCGRPEPTAYDYIRVDVEIECEGSTLICLWYRANNNEHVGTEEGKIVHKVLAVICFLLCIYGRVWIVSQAIIWVLETILRYLAFILGRVRDGESIYDNNQNTHNSDINKSITMSIKALMTDPKPTLTKEQLLAQIRKSGLSAKAMRIITRNCRSSDTRFTCGLTYAELLAYVWQRICKSEHKDELVRILAQEVTRTKGKCFTGQFNSLIGTLAGFEKDIVIQISERAQIGAIVLAIRDRTKPYDRNIHYDQAHQELTAAGYSEAEIKPWLKAIKDMAWVITVNCMIDCNNQDYVIRTQKIEKVTTWWFLQSRFMY